MSTRAPLPADAGVMELSALAFVLQHCPELTDDVAAVVLETRAAALGFDPRSPSLAAAVQLSRPLLPADPESLFRLAGVKARRAAVH